MKKKVIATVLASSLLMMPVSVFADDDDDYLHTLSFDKIAEEVEERSPSVKVLNNQTEITEENFDIQEESIRENIYSQIRSVEAKVKEINGFITHYANLVEYYTSINDADDTYGEIIDVYEEAIAGLQAQLQEYIPEDSDGEYDEDDFDDIKRLSRSGARTSVQMGINGQIYSVQKMYMAYKSLEGTLGDLKNQYDLVDKSNKIAKLQVDLGFATEASTKLSEVNLSKINAGIDATEKALKDLKGSINLALGQDYDTSLDLGDTPIIDQNKIEAMDYEKDYETARDNNYNILLKLNAYRLADKKLDQSTGNQEDLAEIEFDNAEIQYEDQLKKFDLTFENTHRAVVNAQKALDDKWFEFSTKMTDWQQLQLKYSLGMLSTIEWQQAKVTYDSAYLEYKNAQQALYEAYLDYEWLLNGMEFLSSGSSTSAASSGAGSTQSSGMGY